MLTLLFYTVFVLWAVGAIVALVLCDISAQREARARAVKTKRPSHQPPARVATNVRGF